MVDAVLVGYVHFLRVQRQYLCENITIRYNQ